MTLGVSIILSHGGGASWGDSTALVAFAKDIEMLGSWSSCRKTPVGTMPQLESSLTNSYATLFFPHKICKYLRPSKSFSNMRSSW
jgi:hypothetical protein